MYDGQMKHTRTFLFCVFCLLLGTACRNQAQLAKYDEKAEALPMIQRIIQSANKAEIQIVHACLDKKIKIPVPSEQLTKLKELLSHMRPVPPRHRAPEVTSLALARLEFPGIYIADSRVEGYYPSMDIIHSITSESEAFAKNTPCPTPFYLPDDKWAANEALPVIIRMRQTIDRMDREAREALRR